MTPWQLYFVLYFVLACIFFVVLVGWYFTLYATNNLIPKLRSVMKKRGSVRIVYGGKWCDPDYPYSIEVYGWFGWKRKLGHWSCEKTALDIAKINFVKRQNNIPEIPRVIKEYDCAGNEI